MKTNLLYTIIFLFSIFSLSTNAADVVVNGSGISGTYTTISAGINAANPGDRILVSNQSFPYQEDTIFIDKDVTIIPYNDVTNILYEGHIKITLDSISNLTLIGFNSADTDIYSVFNDTSRNSLTTVNIVDCNFRDVYLNLPKTSSYVSHSTINYLYFTHGDIVACNIYRILFGNFDYSTITTNTNPPINQLFFGFYDSNNRIGASGFPDQCQLFSNYIPFGNVNTYSDTCNIVGNSIAHMVILNKDFVFDIRNNEFFNWGLAILLVSEPSQGVNQIINNNFNGNGSSDQNINFNAAYCNSTNLYNFRDISMRILNNTINYGYFLINSPDNTSSTAFISSLNTINIINNSISSYNSTSNIFGDLDLLALQTFSFGPNSSEPNPSAEFLNLDLSLNTAGPSGGSYAWTNINPYGSPGFGSFGSSTNPKARITYLNLPTQIFDPSNIKIKAKAVHGNTSGY